MLFEYRRKIFGYECDMYGHLNNAAYQHIYEEARAAALEEMALSLKDLSEREINIFLKRIEIDYLRAIPFGTQIIIRSKICEYNRVKSVWLQEIYNPAGNLSSKALVTGVFVKDGKPYRIDPGMEEKLGKYARSC